MYYINATPTENGNYGNPQSNGRKDMLALPDDLLPDYLDSMGFVKLTVSGDTVEAVERNEEAYATYQAEHPGPAPLTPTEQREKAYNTDAVIEWDGENITVTAAARLWEYYAAEGSGKAEQLQALIKAAKTTIRERYPDKEELND